VAKKNDSKLEELHRKYGESFIDLGKSRGAPIHVLPTGSLALDRATGVGGYPRGRIVEIYGPESSGKTTLALHAIKSAQANGERAAFIDAEHALDAKYASAVGVSLSDLVFSQPDSAEQGLNMVQDLVDTGEMALVVIDSVAALTPQAEIDGEMGAHHVGLQARLMGQAMRKLAGTANRTGTTLIFLNQLRLKVGVIYGSPETQPGGNALKFYSTLRIDVRRREQVKGDNGPVGNATHIKIVKNKVAPPFQEADFEIRWGHGIDPYDDLINMGIITGVLDKSGAWISYAGQRLGQGFYNAANTLRADAKLYNEILGKVRAAP
jgi:recombination protein RecA